MYKAHSLAIAAALLAAMFGYAPCQVMSAPADDQYAVGAGFYAQQRWQEAADEFASLLADFPDHERAVSARFFRAEALVQLGRYADARTCFTDFLDRHPEHRLARQAMFRAGETAYLSGAGDAAWRDLDKFRRRYPQDALNEYALGYLGEAYLGSNKLTEALAAFQESLRRYPNGSLADESQFGVARVQEQQGDTVEAERSYKLLAEKQDSPLADNAQLQLGLLAYHRGQYSQAIDVLRAFDDELAESDLQSHARYWLGMSQGARGDWKAATETFVGLAAEQPRHELAPAIEFAAGEALRKSGRPADALPHYDRVLTEWPASPWADDSLQAKIQTALETGGSQPLDKLAADFERRFPESVLRPTVRLALGRWRLKREEFSTAIDPLQDYLRAQPEGPDSGKCRGQLAAALAGAKRFREATEALDEFRQRQPYDPLLPPTTLHVAESALAAGELGVAQALFERLSQDTAPADIAAKALAGLAQVQARSEGGEKSAETLERLLKEHADSPQAAEAALQRAKDLEKQGQTKDALAMYQLVLEKYGQAKQGPPAMFGAARLLDQLDQDNAAAEILQRLIKEHPDVPFLEAALYQYAWVLVDLARDAEADAVFARLANGRHDGRYWADATFRLAERAAQTKDHPRALKLAEELLAAKCDDEIAARALYLQGQIATQEQRWKDVEAPLARILQQFPQCDVSLAAEYWIAESKFRLGNLELADEGFARLATKAEGRSEPWLAMVPLRQAQILGHRKQWAQAYEVASRIATQYENFRQQYEVDYLLGRCLGSRGEFDAAREAYERVIRSPDGGRTETAAMAQWMIGESHFHQKHYDEAIKAYHRVERLFDYPRWQAASLLQAGKCYEAKGDWKQASQLYAQLLKDYPDTTYTDEASKRLRAAQEGAARPAALRRN